MARYVYPEKLSPRSRRLRYAARRLGWAAVVLVVVALAMLADRQGFFGRPKLPDATAYHDRSFRVTRVVDGDTLDVATDGQPGRTRVRLLGVDSPETVKPNTPMQRYGPEASAFLKQLVEGKAVTLRLNSPRTRDRYNRLLAYAHLPDGRCVNQLIVSTGHGYADPRFRHPRMEEFRRTQSAARAAGVGLWKDIAEQELPDYLQKRKPQ